MTISRTTLAVVCALPAGALLQAIAHGVFHTGADTLDPAAVAVATVTVCGAMGSAAWHGVQSAIALNQDAILSRRHRRAPAAPTLPRRPRTPAAEPPAQNRPALDARQTFDTTAPDWPTPPSADPYLMPGAVDQAEPEPEPVPAAAEAGDGWEQLGNLDDVIADLYAHPPAEPRAAMDADTAILALEARLRAGTTATL